MGYIFSKHHKKPVEPQREESRPTSAEDKALERIRKSLSYDLETFLLNNILLSVQFFDNFEREIGLLRVNPGTERDANWNQDLAEHQRHCISPDRIYDIVGKRVRFRPEHGERSHAYELLHTPRLIMVQDNVDIVQHRNEAEYSTVMQMPNYRFTLEDVTKNRPGYVTIRAEESMVQNSRRTTYETIKDEDEDDEGVYTCIETDNIEENDSSTTTILENVEEEIYAPQTISPPDSVEENSSQFPQLNPSNVQKANSTKNIFGPQNSNSDSKKEPLFTPTERRLSGIIKSSKYQSAQSVNIKSRTQVLKSAQSLPNLALPGGSKSNGNETNKSGNSPKHSDSSGYKSEGGSPNHYVSPPRSHNSDSSYGYATITELTKPKSLKEYRLGHIPRNTSEIPKECFCKVDLPAYKTDNSNGERRSLFETRYYLNSIVYMQSFADIFTEKLALPFGFSSGLASAILQGPKVCCDIVQNGHDSKPLKIRNEIIPSIKSMSWPVDAAEWKTRTRNRVQDPRPDAAYTWPTQTMLDQVQRLGCHLIPQGYVRTRGYNNEQHLEWQLAFPEAERYLETWLTHSQVRCLLFCLALYKSFLEPLSSHLGLLPSHIRTLLFWQCERNYAGWPEDRPGETLRKFLEKLYEVMSQKKLQDYFVSKRNLFESTPRTQFGLLNVQKKLHHIQENLVMHMLIVVQNLRYVDTSFYPVLDCQKLYHIITDNVLTIVNPRLLINTCSVVEEESEESDEENDESNIDLWKHQKEISQDEVKKWKQDFRTQIEYDRTVQKQNLKKPSRDSIDVNLKPEKGASKLRKKALLEFFIPHFINIAKKSYQHRATRQAKFYLQHAENLVKLLQECDEGGNKSRNYFLEIKNIRALEIKNIHEAISAEPRQGQSREIIPEVLTSERRPGVKVQEEATVHSSKPHREKMELPKDSDLNSRNPKRKKSTLRVKLNRENSNSEPSSHKIIVTVAQVHESSPNKESKLSRKPSSPEIIIKLTESPPISPTFELEEAVTADSTDF